MKRDWNYYDIIDLEYFITKDEGEKETELHKRDRAISLDQTGDNLSDNILLKKWLDVRRSDYKKEEYLPGSISREAHQILRYILIGVGLLTGISSGLLFFSYTGSEPVNVLHFLALFVISQLLLGLVLMSRSVFVMLGIGTLSKTVTGKTLTVFARKLSTTLYKKIKGASSAESTLAIQATLGKIGSKTDRYSALLTRLFFLFIQLFAICFNLGLLAATFFRITVSDIAFGWQSTLQFSAEALHNGLQLLSAPWAWIFSEGTGLPTLSEVEGSRIILKEGIAHLQTPDLVSWWPFLLLCVLVYGLSFRLVLFLVGRYKLLQELSAINLDTPAFRRIVRRMRTQVVSTQAMPKPDINLKKPEESAIIQPSEPQVHIMNEEPDPDKLCVLIPDELFEQCNQKQLEEIVAKEGFAISSAQRFMVDYDSDQKLVEEILPKEARNNEGTVILVESWMPPLVSFLSFLKQFRKKVDKQYPIMVRLVGKPDGESVLTPVRDVSNGTIWKQKIDTIGDPYLELTDLIEEEQTA